MGGEKPLRIDPHGTFGPSISDARVVDRPDRPDLRPVRGDLEIRPAAADGRLSGRRLRTHPNEPVSRAPGGRTGVPPRRGRAAGGGRLRPAVSAVCGGNRRGSLRQAALGRRWGGRSPSFAAVPAHRLPPLPQPDRNPRRHHAGRDRLPEVRRDVRAGRRRHGGVRDARRHAATAEDRAVRVGRAIGLRRFRRGLEGQRPAARPHRGHQDSPPAAQP